MDGQTKKISRAADRVQSDDEMTPKIDNVMMARSALTRGVSRRNW
jgi:hypothetical protein